MLNFLHLVISLPESNVLYTGNYDFVLVSLSIIVAVLASYASLIVSQHVSTLTILKIKRLWIIGGGLCLGVGIWSMHFVGMLAFSLPCSSSYDPVITFLSTIPSILASTLAIKIISHRELTRAKLALGGVLIGAGVGAMHYSGMAAMHFNGLIRYDFRLFMLSIIVAIILATAALWIKFRIQLWQNRLSNWGTIVSAVVLGLAVSGMHYTAMAAAYFIHDGDASIVNSGIEPGFLAAIVLAVTSLIAVVTIVATSLENPNSLFPNRSYKSAILLSLCCGGTAWISADYYYARLADNFYKQEFQLATQQAGDIATNISEHIELLKGISIMESRDQDSHHALRKFQSNPLPSKLAYEKRKQQWTKDSELNELNYSLSIAASNLGADVIYLLNAAGDCISSSNASQPDSFVGTNYTDRDYFLLPRSGKPGHQYAVGRASKIPGLFYSYPISENGHFLGVAVVKRNITKFSQWIDPVNAFITDINGVVVLTSDARLRLHTMPDATVAKLSAEKLLLQYKQSLLTPLRIKAWENSRFSSAVLIGNDVVPVLLVSKQLSESNISIFVPRPLGDLIRFDKEKYWLFFLLFTIGSLLITTAVGVITYFTESHKAAAESRIAATAFESLEGMIITDANNLIMKINHALTEITGYKSDEVRGLNPGIFGSGNHDAEFYLGMWKSINNTGVWKGEILNRRKNGEIYPGYLAINTVKDQKGVITNYVATLVDVTQRKLAELTENRLKRALRLLSAGNTTLVRAKSEQELLASVCRLSIDTGGYRLAWIGYAENDTNKTVRPIARSGYDDGYIDGANITWADEEQGRGPVGTAIRNRITVIVQDFATHPNTTVWRDAAIKRGYQSCIALPLVIDDRAIGSLNIYSNESDTFGQEEVKLLEELAEDLAYGIKTLRVRVEHEKAQLALKKESERNIAFLHNASDGIHIVDTEGNIIEASNSFCAMLGYQREEVIGMNASCWDATFKGEELISLIGQLLNKHGRFQFETCHRRKDGTTFDVEVSSFPLELEGRPVLFCSSRDITEYKKAVTALRDSNQQMDSLLNSMAEGAYGTDTHGNCSFVNRAFLRILGYDNVDEIIGKNIHGLIHHSYPDGRPYPASACRMYSANINNLEIHAADEVLWRKDGTPVPVEFWSQPIIIDKVALGSIITFIDITERKKSENELKIAATAFETQEGMLITDANSLILRANQAFTEITGYTIEEITGKTPRILNSGRHDAGFFIAMWESILNTGHWEGEIWNRRKNGEIYPQHLTITAVKDFDGSIINYVGTFNDITMRIQAEEQIRHLAFYDHLTDLPNRRLLQDRLQQALSSSGRSDRLGSILLIDLDNFKNLNDTLGHDKGDLLLKQVAERLTSCVREGDSVARLGGDEFVVVLTELSKDSIEAAAQTEAVGMKILHSLSHTYQLSGAEFRCTTSIGAALFLDHKQSIEDLLKQADIAMYQAKKAGRNDLRFFDQKMQDTINTRAALEDELIKAINNHQFHLYYQIQVDHLNHPLGAEALIRWVHPEKGLVSPAQFIPLAEETGLILAMGHWVLDTACSQIKAWQKDALTCNLTLAVNVSALQFRQPDFVNQVQESVKRHAINPALLKLELTESLMLAGIEEIITTMTEMKKIGVQFSLDDFGTGYSSLQYLKRLPLDQLKIDQSFVRDIVVDSSDRAIVRTIISMAHSLSLNVIAEGVETEEQRQLLLDKGCTQYQGYLFGKPMPIEQFDERLKLS